MADILACRICLNTNVKLYDIYKYRLVSAYENLTGSKVLPIDGCPKYTCNVCSTFLLKCLSFKSLCQRSQDLLKYAYRQNHQITTEYITSLDLNMHILSKYSISRNKNISLPCDQSIKIKDEVSNYDDGDSGDDTDNFRTDEDTHTNIGESKKEVKSELSSSDEEPLSSKKAKKKKVKVKKTVVKSKKQVTAKHNGNQDNLDNGNQDNDPVSEGEVNNAVDSLDSDEVEVTILTKEQQLAEVKARMSSMNYRHSFYKCDMCYKGFMSAATFNNHMIRHELSAGSHVCEICQTRWPNVRSLRTHVVTSHERKFVCKLCAHVSKSRHKAKEHFKWHSGHKFVCNICGASFEKSTSHLNACKIQASV
ncbi:hypothetical protein evm_006265 [Chilo suppressalis]|nr:hypothetical protein evm_006265 [Chilo suppressalis]